MGEKGLILVTGGARSGKSSFGESLLENIDDKVLYVATAQAFDDEMKDRIKKHREGRLENWITIEGYKSLHTNIEGYKNKISGIFLDCVTIMITNLMLEEPIDWDNITQQQIDLLERKIFNEVQALICTVKSLEIPAVFITNEIGLGIVPENKLARIFRDIAGRMNQYIGKEADHVYFVVCGIPSKIK
ncbi:adenosylcobinamide kinase /adenosylcobinamide-phosphate guanylyltransferase [Anaerovirgula multivorans]|uniref:Adenosylcobinamide kinase n=1 Tax=Anaerovirgula multivorans TaxID=312168 RepID=A0A239H6M3_9FIRM|nr:bifunctional adenosylcobinamide kinase/adenosylcobinamide-phosphate guanylyltransferase [Anaerovirgula multivorans]SNS76668.1 adenosylcobinamide kinase /adenosylcobinamide-phosphate guanylyltransferase [Anaerovirgula multivorans]